MAARVNVELDPAILEFFESLTGSGAVNLTIVAPKYEALRSIGKRFIRRLDALCQLPALQDMRPEITAECERISQDFVTTFDQQFCAPTRPPAAMFDCSESTKDYRSKYGELYRRSKQAPCLALLLSITSQMISLRFACEEGGIMGLAAALALAPADEIRAFAWGSLEDAPDETVGLRALHAENPDCAEQVWSELLPLLALGLELFGVLEEPDFDSTAIAQAVASSLGGCQKSLRGCDRAFQLIKSSTDLFEQNASRYQRVIEQSGNPLMLFQCYCEDLEKHATAKLNGGTPAEKNHARRTKMELCRVMNYVNQTTQKMRAVSGQSAGGRLLNVLSKQIERTQDSLTEELLAEERSRGEDAVQRMQQRLREHQVTDTQAAQAAAETLAQRGDAMLLLDGPPVGTELPPGGEPWNLNAVLASLGEPLPSKRKKGKRGRGGVSN